MDKHTSDDLECLQFVADYLEGDARSRMAWLTHRYRHLERLAHSFRRTADAVLHGQLPAEALARDRDRLQALTGEFYARVTAISEAMEKRRSDSEPTSR